ncbi:MAG: flagellar basal body P-ring formation chaperone FlgA [Alphaproteobacteria bacterium]
MNKLLITVMLVGALTPLSASAASVTAKANLQRGSILSSDDVHIKVQAGESREDIMSIYVGKELKRSIAKGYKLAPGYVGNPVVVRRNSRVSMIYRAGGLEISAWGRALDEGGAGDIISIMNLDSRKRVQGRILESGSVEVGL